MEDSGPTIICPDCGELVPLADGFGGVANRSFLCPRCDRVFAPRQERRRATFPMNLTALIADDVFDMRFLLRQRLEERGAEIVGEATDTEEAIDLAVRLRPRLVVSDLFLSAKDPASYVRRFREALPSACIVLMSASPPDAPAVAAAVAAGADGYLDKGEGFSAMAARIAELCADR